MIENYKVITANHLLSDVSLLGDFMISEDSTVSSLSEVKEKFGISEMIYLTTCNRVMYLLYSNQNITKEFLYNFFRLINPNLSENNFSNFITSLAVYEGMEAVQHCMEVAGSIDSLVVGEREIFRQFREAYNKSLEQKVSGDKLRILEKKIVQTVKNIHTNTRIGEKPLSIASLAMTTLLNEIHPEGNNIAVIGAGETNKLLCKLLKPKGLGQYSIFNRTLANAKSLAKFIDGRPFGLNDLNSTDTDFDVFIVTTSSSEPLLTKGIFDKISARSHKKRIIVDLSVPSNVDSSICQLDTVKYICIDDLKVLAAYNLEYRKKEITLAKEIIQKSITQFPKEYQEREIELALADVPKEINKIKRKAIDDVYKKRINGLSSEAQNLIIEMMDYMEQKCISAPIKAAKKKIL